MAVPRRWQVAMLLVAGAALTVCMLSATLHGMWSIALVVVLALLLLVGRTPGSKRMGGHAWNR